MIYYTFPENVLVLELEDGFYCTDESVQNNNKRSSVLEDSIDSNTTTTSNNNNNNNNSNNNNQAKVRYKAFNNKVIMHLVEKIIHL